MASPTGLHFLSAGGETGALIRGFDWSDSPLGPPEQWPLSLRTAVGIVLSSKFPMFLAWGTELIFLYNDPYSEVLGGKHPAIGMRFKDVWAEIWSDIGPLADRALAGEATYWENLPLTLMRRGYGEQTWFTFSYSPLHGDDGGVCGLLCACVETTAAVLAERRRVSEAERLRQLFDRAPSFIAVLRGPDHVFELANAAYLDLVGRRDLIGQAVRQALPEVAGQGFFQLLDDVYRSGEAHTGHSVPVALRPAGGGEPQRKLVDFLYQPILEPDGSVGGIFVEGYDVTARLIAEEKLRESEERFRLIANSAPVPMWVTKLDRKRSFVNQAYADFVGLTVEEALDYDWREIIHPEDIERLVAESLAGEATLKPFRLEARYRRADGEWRWLRSESQPRWGADGGHVGFIGIASDITEPKRAEAALREVNEVLERRVAERTADLSAALDRLQAEVAERQRAEEALRQAQKMEAVGQLTGGIAHDFNNLLTPILGGLEMIAKRIEDPRLKRIAENALESSRRGAKLTSQLLAFSRIQRISMVPVAVNQVIGNMRHILKHSIGPSIEILTDLAPDVGHAVCDENQLENAVLNLAINARDAMPEGGTLTIATALVHQRGLGDVEEGDYVCIAVRDTGQGMAPEVLARAMEPFYSTKPMGKGTGLGLAQVYGIAQQSGGTVRIRSEAGTGTEVTILLPAAAGATTAPALPPDYEERATAGVARARVLVVDDDPDVRGFLADALDGLGHEAEVCDGGEAALTQMERDRPDLMLIDFAMPGMNGAELAREVRARRPDVPIVFVTGYSESEQLERAIGGEVHVLKKPFGLQELAQTLQQVLG